MLRAAVLPAPFSHGLIVGLLVGPLALVGVVLVVLRRFRRLAREAKLDPPPLPTAAWDRTPELTDLDGATADLSGAACFRHRAIPATFVAFVRALAGAPAGVGSP